MITPPTPLVQLLLLHLPLPFFPTFAHVPLRSIDHSFTSLPSRPPPPDSEAVDDVLRSHEASLRALFGAMQDKRGAAKKLVTMECFLGLLRKLDFLAPDFSETHAAR